MWYGSENVAVNYQWFKKHAWIKMAQKEDEVEALQTAAIRVRLLEELQLSRELWPGWPVCLLPPAVLHGRQAAADS